jgi:hypothetical protein
MASFISLWPLDAQSLYLPLLMKTSVADEDFLAPCSIVPTTLVAPFTAGMVTVKVA